MFLYTDDAKFEENDFVVSGNTIYICKPKGGVTEVSGESPGESDNYIVYLGDQSMNINEYLEFLETGEGENKYLSVLTLQTVLNHFILGPDGKGIIGDSISYSPSNGSYKLSNGALFNNPNTVLADIMNHPDINHALLKVSRLLPEIIVYVGNLDITEDNEGCILRQYTYLSETNGHKIRIQELIDPFEGLIYYRSADIDVDSVTSTTNFKCSISNPEALKNKADNIFSLYNSRLKVLRSLEEHLKSNFRYRRIEISGKPKDIIIPEIGYNLPEITVMITEYDQEKMLRYNSEISFSLSDRDSSGNIPLYGIGGNYRIRTIVSISGDVSLYLEKISSSSRDYWISGVYYREYYEL